MVTDLEVCDEGSEVVGVLPRDPLLQGGRCVFREVDEAGTEGAVKLGKQLWVLEEP